MSASGARSRWGGLSAAQRRLLVACGGGAGLAAVYNVPLAGALFPAEILIGSITLPVMLPAIACSAIATATAWVYLPDRAVYLGIPDYRFTWPVMTWALLAGPVIGLVSAGYIRLIGWVSHHRARGTRALVAPVIAFGILGVIGIWYPQLFGNGAAMIGAAMQAPLSGLALVLELTPSGFGLMVPMMAATGIATLVAFHVDGYSIYSARLPAFADDSAPAAAAGRRAQPGSRSGRR